MFIVMNMFNIHVFQEHDEPILKHLQDIRVVFTGPDSMVDTTQYPQPTPMVCNNFTFYFVKLYYYISSLERAVYYRIWGSLTDAWVSINVV